MSALDSLIPGSLSPLVHGPAAAAGASILAEVLHSPQASVRIPARFRAARSLNASARRAARERVYLAVRSHALLEALLRAGGWTGEEPGRALWLQLAVLCGFPAHEAAESGLARFDATPSQVLPDEAVARRAMLASLPEWFAAQVDDAFAVACGERAPVTVRVNARRESIQQVMRRLEGFEPRPTTFASHGLFLERGQIQESSAWREGLIEVQDEGSQLIATLVKPPARSTVLDYCAGAGGKALAIAAHAPRRCRVYIHDVREKALDKAQRRAKRAGAALSRGLPEQAHRVLVDAPCTGSGTLRRDPARRWRLTTDFLHEMVDLQRQVALQAARRVAPGGRLIYATCSVCPQENEEQLDFLRSTLDWPLVPVREVLGRALADRVGDGQVLRVGPESHGTDGFYAAILRRP